MDFLSDVVASMRTGTPGAARVAWHGTWRWWLPGESGVAGFLVVLDGNCRMYPEQGGDPVALGPGDVVFSPHGGGYGLADSPGPPPVDTLEEARPGPEGFDRAEFGDPASGRAVVTVCGGYRLDRDRPHPLLSELPDHVLVRADDNPNLGRVVDGLAEEIDRPRPGSDALALLLLDELLLHILRACLTAPSSAASGWAGALADPGIGAALGAVHGDPAHPWTVSALAERARLSRATFARRFSALLGQPPMAYVTWWRLSSARVLLRDTDLPVEAVAERIGYTSAFAFGHAFRRAYGAPPGRFRRAMRRHG